MVRMKEKSKKAEKVPFGSLGGKCPVCKKEEAIIASEKKPHISFGDGMAGMTHINIEVELPLLCKFCDTPLKAKRESTFIVIFARVFGRRTD